MIPLFKENTEIDECETLERKMIRTMALHRELKLTLAAEYDAGKEYNPKALAKLTLRKRNSVNRFEHMVRTISAQLRRMTGRDLPPTVPRTLANRVRSLPGLTPEHESVLIPLARDLEAEHRTLIEKARRNSSLFKTKLTRLRAAGSYADQGKFR